VLQIAPSTYYDTKSRPPSAREIRDQELGPKIQAIWKKNYSVYGRRKLTRAAATTASASAVTRWPGS